MTRTVRSACKRLFNAFLSHPLPLPKRLREGARDATRALYHRSPHFRHDSRLHAAPLLLRLIHTSIVRDCPSDFTIYGGLLRFRSSGSPMSIHGYYVGEFEYHLLRFIVSHLREGESVLDIGAHHGEFAVPLAYEFKTRGWKSRVISFEPDQRNVALIDYNLRQNGVEEFAEVHPVAVSDRTETAELVCPRDNSSNTLAVNGEYAIGDELGSAERRIVSTVRIDDCDFGPSRIGLVKLDIQGSEPEALAGAAATLARHRPIVVVEVVESWPRVKDVQRILTELGYTLHGLTRDSALVPITHPDVFVSWDWVAVPDGSAGLDQPAGRSATALAALTSPGAAR